MIPVLITAIIWILVLSRTRHFAEHCRRLQIRKAVPGEVLGRRTTPGNLLTDFGVEGDRRIVIVNHDGRVITARRYPQLLGLKGSLGKDGTPLIQDRPWNDPESLARVREATGRATELLEAKGKESFDVLPLSLATDGASDYLGVDRRRFRPNLLIGGVQELPERNWEGLALHIGNAVICMAQLRGGCVMTTWDPDTQVREPSVLRRIMKELDGTLSPHSFVEQEGTVHVGDPVELIND
jgi:uncharacterized protein